MAQAVMTPQVQDSERYFTLVSGHRIPAVGLGTWRSASRAHDSVFTAIVEVFFMSKVELSRLLFYYRFY